MSKVEKVCMSILGICALIAALWFAWNIINVAASGLAQLLSSLPR